MKSSYTTIYFKDKKLNHIFNATLDNDFHSEEMVGKTKILEEEIPKRDIPYFYGISRSPLEFEVTFAFNKPMDIYEIKSYVEFFTAEDTYQPLAFEREDGFITPIYYVIATDSIETEYIRTRVNQYVGYFQIKFRANAPYGFEEDANVEIKNNTRLNLSNASLPSQHLILTIVADRNMSDISIRNKTNETKFEISKMESGEKITLDLRNFRIETNDKTSISVYERWQNRDIKTLLTLEPKVNDFEVTENVYVRLTYKIPRFI